MSFLLNQVRRVLVRLFCRQVMRRRPDYCAPRPPLSVMRVGEFAMANREDWNRHLIECAETPWLSFWREGWCGKRLGQATAQA